METKNRHNLANNCLYNYPHIFTLFNGNKFREIEEQSLLEKAFRSLERNFLLFVKMKESFCFCAIIAVFTTVN